jgi:hypothetical protein
MKLSQNDDSLQGKSQSLNWLSPALDKQTLSENKDRISVGEPRKIVKGNCYRYQQALCYSPIISIKTLYQENHHG